MELTPPSDDEPPLRRSSRASQGARCGVVFDEKYHPMDEIIRPSNARKRRQLYRRPQGEDDNMVEDNDDDDNDDEESESTGGHEQEESDFSSSPLVKKATKFRRDSRHSTRLESLPTPNYSKLVHPQDESLEEAGIIRKQSIHTTRKRRRRNSEKSRRRKTTNVETRDTEDYSDVENAMPVKERRTMSDATSLLPKSPRAVINPKTIEEEITRYTQAWEALVSPKTQLREAYSQAWVAFANQAQIDAREMESELNVSGHAFMEAIEANEALSDISQAGLDEKTDRTRSDRQRRESSLASAPYGYGKIAQHTKVASDMDVSRQSSPPMFETQPVPSPSSADRPVSAGSTFPTEFDQGLETIEHLV